jgi:hypothetical protein
MRVDGKQTHVRHRKPARSGSSPPSDLPDTESRAVSAFIKQRLGRVLEAVFSFSSSTMEG